MIARLEGESDLQTINVRRSNLCHLVCGILEQKTHKSVDRK